MIPSILIPRHVVDEVNEKNRIASQAAARARHEKQYMEMREEIKKAFEEVETECGVAEVNEFCKRLINSDRKIVLDDARFTKAEVGRFLADAFLGNDWDFERKT
jgi:DNA-directed RNA polymerase sigma subunit (sigma70/sigma32)